MEPCITKHIILHTPTLSPEMTRDCTVSFVYKLSDHPTEGNVTRDDTLPMFISKSVCTFHKQITHIFVALRVAL